MPQVDCVGHSAKPRLSPKPLSRFTYVNSLSPQPCSRTSRQCAFAHNLFITCKLGATTIFCCPIHLRSDFFRTNLITLSNPDWRRGAAAEECSRTLAASGAPFGANTPPLAGENMFICTGKEAWSDGQVR